MERAQQQQDHKDPKAAAKLRVSEIFVSLQGESTWAGLPCTFIRLSGCPLRCSYCDTAYAYYGGTEMEIFEVLAQTAQIACPLVEVTGGEPLAQPECVALLKALVESGYTTLLETSGALSIAQVPFEVRKIMDLKCPSSGQSHRNRYENVHLLAPHDEVKFVLGDREDYEWAKRTIARLELARRCHALLFSCVFGRLSPQRLAGWMLDDRLFGVRMQLQAHKHIWPPDAQGV